ncbi:MAG: molybdenum ABC transporter ATP-binding protein [Devosia sp.]|nr:molybdenum ABC transporter ATP-binding protein [Devosia sp.]
MSGLGAHFRGRRGDFVLDAAFEAPPGRVTALFGPSGAGKTSILRAIAGLERFAGDCTLDGQVWQDGSRFLQPHRRAIGYVFQEASLFPHLSVRGNLEFGLRRAEGTPVTSFDGAVALLGLGPLLGRAPATLSGGERQRVALGRALLARPRLLLLDEPLSALDRQAKQDILPYFEALHRSLTLPVVLVTHDIAEVERLADRLVLLEGGRVIGAGPLNEMLVHGASSLRTARDAAAVLSGEVVAYDRGDGLSTIEIDGWRVLMAGRAGTPGEAVRVRIAARDVSLATERPSATTILNVFETKIETIEVVSDAEAIVTLRLGTEPMLARVTRRSIRQLGLAPGQPVFAQVKGVSLIAGPGG